MLYNKSLSPSSKRIQIQSVADKLIQVLENNSKSIIDILTDYQAIEVSHYEIDRCIRTLKGLNFNFKYLAVDKKIASAAVMLPSNLPLYSLFVFALIPSFQAQEVYVRPNSLLQEHNIISRLFNTLNLHEIFPQVRIFNTNHQEFEKCITRASLVIFTGKPENADQFLKKMQDQSILVVNGSGHNPLVITDTANVQKAVEDACLVKSFNGGQDCAGPDAILVHANIAKEFIASFQEKYTQTKTGLFKSPDTVIGPIGRFEELERIGKVLHSYRRQILAGGVIDYKNGIVSPTIIVTDIEDNLNYKEMYSPICFIHTYKSDNDLAKYFEGHDHIYNANRMYVSLYGHSDYVCNRDDSLIPGKAGNVGIVLHNQIIHDVEIGYAPYGGFGKHASAVIQKTATAKNIIPMPILIPQVIKEFLIEAKLETTVKNNFLSRNLTRQAVNEFSTLVAKTFAGNLSFAFVFGSATENKLKNTGENRSDLDTFVCLIEENESHRIHYLKELRKIHYKYNLKVDDIFPTEMMSLSKLQKSMASLADINVSLNRLVEGEEYDSIFWACVLTETRKCALNIVDKTAMLNLIELAKPHIKRWSEQILSELMQLTSLPIHLKTQFAESTDEQIIINVQKMKDHELIKTCLQFNNSNSNLAHCLTEVKTKKSIFSSISASGKTLAIDSPTVLSQSY